MQLTQIGYTMKPHGLVGEIKVHIEEQWDEVLDALTVLYIEVKGQKLPYFLEQIRGGGALIAKFEGVDDRNAALTISSKKIFARDTDLPEIAPVVSSETPDYHGFTVKNTEGQALGVITELVEYPYQVLAVLTSGDKKIMFPLVTAYIKDSDLKERQLIVDLPEGLLDLNE